MLVRPSLLALALCGAPLLGLGCKSSPSKRDTSSRTCGDSIHDLAWMAGSWRQDKPGTAMEEFWTHADGGTLLGVSRTIVRNKTVFFEYLRIEARADGLYYVAQPMGRPATDFKLVRCNSNGVLFENPRHDHPKRIFYQRPSAHRLTAHIEGDENGKAVSQDFDFTRM